MIKDADNPEEGVCFTCIGDVFLSAEAEAGDAPCGWTV